MRKPVVLFMALCVRRPEIIKAIMEIGCREGADVLAKAVKTNMPKLTKAAAVKHGTCSLRTDSVITSQLSFSNFAF